jgi:hypothetical protein
MGFIRDGRLYLLEVKTEDGKPTKEQLECLAACEAAGAIEYGLDAWPGAARGLRARANTANRVFQKERRENAPAES